MMVERYSILDFDLPKSERKHNENGDYVKYSDYLLLEQERNDWRDAAQSITPGGSEFTSPESVLSYTRKLKDDLHESKCKAVTLTTQLQECRHTGWVSVSEYSPKFEEPMLVQTKKGNIRFVYYVGGRARDELEWLDTGTHSYVKDVVKCCPVTLPDKPQEG